MQISKISFLDRNSTNFQKKIKNKENIYFSANPLPMKTIGSKLENLPKPKMPTVVEKLEGLSTNTSEIEDLIAEEEGEKVFDDLWAFTRDS